MNAWNIKHCIFVYARDQTLEFDADTRSYWFTIALKKIFLFNNIDVWRTNRRGKAYITFNEKYSKREFYRYFFRIFTIKLFTFGRFHKSFNKQNVLITNN